MLVFISDIHLADGTTGESVSAGAFEILIGTPLVCDMIKRGDVGGIKEVMEKSENLGMATFDQALFRLYEAGRITEEEALRNADSANNLRLKINLRDGDPDQIAAETKLTIMSEENDQQDNSLDFNTSNMSLK